MSDSQSQQTNPLLSLMAVPGMEAWRKATEDYLERVKALYEEGARAEGMVAQQSRVMIDESARLMRESLNYTAQLTAEWRKLGLETTRRTMEMLTPGSGQGKNT